MNRRESIIAIAAVGAAVGPLASFAQLQGKVARIGFLTLNSASLGSTATDAFLKGMRELGYVEGKSLEVEWRFADGNAERLPGMAAELVRLRVDVIVAAASPAIGASQKATNTIPIVMASTGDPVASGFVKNLARPGGNITGLSNMGGELGAKHLDLLLVVVPKLSRVGLLVSPTSTTYRVILESVQGAAQKAAVTTLVFEASSSQEIENAFSMLVRERAGAVIVGAAPFFTLQKRQIAQLAHQIQDAIDLGKPGNCRSRGAH